MISFEEYVELPHVKKLADKVDAALESGNEAAFNAATAALIADIVELFEEDMTSSDDS